MRLIEDNTPKTHQSHQYSSPLSHQRRIRYFKPSRWHKVKTKHRKRQRRNHPRRNQRHFKRIKDLQRKKKLIKRLKEKKENYQLYLECRNEIKRQKNQQLELLNALFGIDNDSTPDNIAYVIDARTNHPLSFENSINKPLLCDHCNGCNVINCIKCNNCEFCIINKNDEIIDNCYSNFINKSDIISRNITHSGNINHSNYINNCNNCNNCINCNNCDNKNKFCKSCNINSINDQLAIGNNLDNIDKINSMDILDYILLANQCNQLNCQCIHSINSLDKSKYHGKQWPEDTVLISTGKKA